MVQTKQSSPNQTKRNGLNRTRKWSKPNTKMVQTKHKNGSNQTCKWFKPNIKMVQTKHVNGSNQT